jgi:hypothetical protein
MKALSAKTIFYRLTLPPILIVFLLAGCTSLNPFSKKEKPCRYRDVFTVCEVVGTSPEAIEFEVSGHRRISLDRSELNPEYPYNLGDQHNARQRFLVEGDKNQCEKYILQVLRRR